MPASFPKINSTPIDINLALLYVQKCLHPPVNAERPVPVAARAKAWVYGRSSAEIVGSTTTGGHGCLSVVLCVVR